MNSSSFKLRFVHNFLRSLSKIKSQKPNSDFRRRSKRIKMAAYSSMAQSVGPKKAWARALLFKLKTRPKFYGLMKKKQLLTSRKKIKIKGWRKRSSSMEKNSRNQMEKLRELVPGGEAMDVVRLLEETAHYVLCLKTQVHVMNVISNHY